MQRSEVTTRVLAWYDANARDLPWRREGVGPWAVLVSEFMCQQTPVARVVEPWAAWLERWPTPAALAQAPVGDAIRQWGRLGYPRRAQRLHTTARTIVERHSGTVPADYAQLRELPGVGDYTAAAILSFAFGQRHVVLDTNVRRVLLRLDYGEALPGASLTRAERERARRWLPDEPGRAARWAVASMELGARVCTAAKPRCVECPVTDSCAWLRLGRPEPEVRRKTQPYEGTDRQCRGVLLAVLRHRPSATRDELLAAWPDPEQAEAALTSLVADGLVRAAAQGFSL
ncbi:MAG: A/G-specific adenine glycosylase [Micropruina sp.]